MIAAVIWFEDPVAPKFNRSLKVGHLVALDMAPHFVAKEAGFFRKEGLDVEFSFLGVHENNQALREGLIDISLTPFTLPYIEREKGTPMTAIGACGGWGVVQLVARKDLGFDSMETLSAHVRRQPEPKLKIGALKGDNIDLLVTAALSEVGLTRDDVEMVLVKDILELVSLFKTSQLDILSHIKPYTTELVQKHGAVVLTDDAALWGSGTPNCVIGVHDDILKHHPKIVRKYLRAIRQAADLINANPDRAIETLEQSPYPYFRVPYDVVRYGIKRQVAPITFQLNSETINAIMFDLKEHGYLENYQPFHEVFDSHWLPPSRSP